MRSPGRYVSRGICSRTGRTRLGAAEVDDDVAALEPAHDARDELALAVLVLVEDDVALGVADALEDDLLGRLRGDAAEALAARLQLEQLAELVVLLLGRAVLLVVEDLEAELVAERPPRGCASRRPRGESRARRRSPASTTVMYWKRSTWPVSSLNRASSSRFGPKARLAAVRMASSRVSTSTDRSMFLSLETWSRTRPRAAPSFMKRSGGIHAPSREQGSPWRCPR